MTTDDIREIDEDYSGEANATGCSVFFWIIVLCVAFVATAVGLLIIFTNI